MSRARLSIWSRPITSRAKRSSSTEAVTFELEASASALEIGPRTTYGTIIVVGGGCYGSYYVRQLRRGYAAGAIRWDTLIVVDRDPACAVAKDFSPAVRCTTSVSESIAIDRDPESVAPYPELVVGEWSAFFREYLSRAGERDERLTDAIVPSPLMPHLLYEWLLERARERWPARHVHSRPLTTPPKVPWHRAGADGTHYVSFAEWMCPVNCVEPRLCPHTRGERTWSLPVAVRDYIVSENARGNAMGGPVIFHCTHRAFGVGMIDTADVVEADRLVTRDGASGPVNILVGTVSHCHGALNLLSVSGTSF